MTARDILKRACHKTGITQEEAAHRIGMNKKQLSSRIANGTLRADAFMKLLDAIGVDITFTLRETGEKINFYVPGVGPRVIGLAKGVTYDTKYASALANSFWVDGKNKWRDEMATELYVDGEGKYFLAEYSNLKAAKNRVIAISDEEAAEYLKKYGTELHRGPVSEEVNE